MADESPGPVQLVCAAFNDEDAAREALEQLTDAKRAGLVGIGNAAILRKDDRGKLHINETADMGGGRGATIGGVVGAGIGAIAGAALVAPLAVGALIGGLVAKLRDSGFSDERLERLGAELPPGSSVIVAVVEHRWAEDVDETLTEAGADAVTEALGADIAAHLEAGHDVAYTALVGEQGLAAGRLAVGDDEAEGGMIVLDDAGGVAGRFVATEDGFAVRAVEADEAGVTTAGAVAVATDDD